MAGSTLNFISLQLRELGQSDNVFIYEEARTKAKIHIVHKKIEHKDWVFYIMALPVMEFQDQGYKIRKIFA